MIELGFTGTREGLAEAQRRTLGLVLTMARMGNTTDIRVHHGSCVGADEQVHQFCFTYGFKRGVHPPLDEKHLANCPTDFEFGDQRWAAKHYLDRNRDIVDCSAMLIACPKSRTEEVRGSGTWATVRYAQNQHKTVLGIYPDGSFDWL